MTAGFAIYDTMRYIRSPVATFCMGFAASMGSFLLMAGEAGRRFSMPNARIMVHEPSGGFQGKASDIARHAQDVLETRRQINRLYARHCGRTVEEIERALDRDNFMSAEQARDFGLIDEVTETRAAA